MAGVTSEWLVGLFRYEASHHESPRDVALMRRMSEDSCIHNGSRFKDEDMKHLFKLELW